MLSLHRKFLAAGLAFCLVSDSCWAGIASRSGFVSSALIISGISGTISTQALAGHAFFSGTRGREREEIETLHEARDAYRSVPAARPLWRRRWLQPVLIGFAAMTTLLQGLIAQEKPSTPKTGQDTSLQALSTDEKTLFWPSAFDSVPSKDLFSMLNWVPDSQLQTLFGAIYEWYTVSHPGVSQESFYNSVQNGSVKDMKSLLEVYLKANPGGHDRADAVLSLALHHVNDVLSDPGFRALQAELKKAFFHVNPPDEPVYETFLIWVEDPLEREALLHSLRSLEFQEFHKFLHNAYGINPNLRLVSVLHAYLFPPQNRKLRQPSFAAAYKLIRRYFPGPHLKTLRGINLVDSIPVKGGRESRQHDELLSQLMATRQGRKQVEAELRERRQKMDRLMKLYSVSPNSFYHYETVLEASRSGH
jgi:hypothetical protein